jgi:hypothetical protein
MGTEYRNYYNWTMPDGSVVQTRTPEPPEGYIGLSQGPQGAAGARGLDALPEAFSAQYGWANPYMQTDMAYQQPQYAPQQAAAPPAVAPTAAYKNPISLMSQFSGYGSPTSLMSMESSALRPQGPSWKM